MAWFPENQNLPKDTNMRFNFENLAQIIGKINSHPCINCEDLSFIIPVGFDSEDRVKNFGICLLSILFNTNAKIHVYWSDTETLLSNLGIDRNSQFKFLFNLFQKNKKNQNVLEDQQFLVFFVNCFLKSHLFRTRLNNEYTLSESLQILTSNNNIFKADLDILLKLDKWLINQVKERLVVNLELREEGNPFHRTKYLNHMLDYVKTSVVVNHDADILLPTQTILSAYTMIKDLNIDVVYPYGYSAGNSIEKYSMRVFLNDTDKTYNSAIEASITGNFWRLDNIGKIMKWTSCYGQSIFLNVNKYKSSGGENEDFISWGAEDVERYVRFIKLGYFVSRIRHGNIYHLEHSRGPDSSSSNNNFKDNELLWEKLQQLNKEQLLDYYKNCNYLKKYKWSIENNA